MRGVEEIRNVLNPMKDIEFFPFSAERKIYTDKLWNKLEEYIK